MDHRKHPFLDHIFAVISSRRRVLSGFALGVAASLLVVTLLASTNAPAAVSSTPASLFSWFFSTSYSSSTLFAGKNGLFPNSTGSHGGVSALQSANVTSLTEALEWNFSRPLSEQDSQKIHHLNPVKSSSSSLDENSADSISPGNFTSRYGNGTPFAQSGRQNAQTAALEKSEEVGVRGDGETRQKLNDASSGKNESLQKLTARSSDDSSVSVKAMGGVLQKNCDIFDGRWVMDSTKPYYPPGSCPYIDVDFDCEKNGRPDHAFLRWRWQPHDCDIPSLNATDFLERLRGKRILFVGDSLNRNMWESLVCILHHSLKNKSRVYEVSGQREFKLHGYYSIKFEDYMSSVDFVRSPFLVKEVFLENVNGSKDERLILDVLDETTTAYLQADIVVFNTGHWWTHEKTASGINYYQEGNYVYPVLEVMKAFKKALTTWASWIDRNIDSSTTQVVFRGYSLTHFRGGQWNSGGQCHKEVEPIYNETFLIKYPEKMRALEEVLREMQTPVLYLNISRLTDYRKDGHPSIYRKKYNSEEDLLTAPKTQDCSHWCLPGVPDTWNELLYAHLLIDGKGSWRL